jgi:hypothetical protein
MYMGLHVGSTGKMVNFIPLDSTLHQGSAPGVHHGVIAPAMVWSTNIKHKLGLLHPDDESRQEIQRIYEMGS